jgi:EpsI family protein
MISKGRVFIVLALFAATGFLLQMTSEVTPTPIKKALGLFPHQIGDYHLSKSFQSSSDVLELLGVDDYLQYNYIDNTTNRINLYVGYYKAVGVSGGYHSPKNCLPGGGWGIDGVKNVVLAIGDTGNRQATVSQMVIRNGTEYQVVLYWYQNRGRIIASEYWEKVYLVLDALLMGRRDGSFVRIMATVPDKQIDTTAIKLQKFAGKTMALLEQHLPGEQL